LLGGQEEELGHPVVKELRRKKKTKKKKKRIPSLPLKHVLLFLKQKSCFKSIAKNSLRPKERAGEIHDRNNRTL
jgi:spore cortex formation protein SpoVR/YcgB (stage V sporulation)